MCVPGAGDCVLTRIRFPRMDVLADGVFFSHESSSAYLIILRVSVPYAARGGARRVSFLSRNVLFRPDGVYYM